MSQKIHMQDQVFNKVKHIMQHRCRMPIHLRIAGISITMQFPVEFIEGRRRVSDKMLSH